MEGIHNTIQRSSRQPTIKERHRPRGINHDTPSKKHNKELTKVTLATTDRENARVVISVCRDARGKNKPGKKMAEVDRATVTAKNNGDGNASEKEQDTYIIIANPPPFPLPPAAIGTLAKLGPRAVRLSIPSRFHIAASAVIRIPLVRTPGIS